MEGREGPGVEPTPSGAPEGEEKKVASQEVVAATVATTVTATVATATTATAATTATTATTATIAPATLGASPVSMALEGMKKKRGRPRKYAPDGSLVLPLSLTPISSSTPGEFTLTSGESTKRGRARPAWSKVFLRPELEVMGELPPGVSFMPHIISIDAGEDITTRIMVFSQRGPRAVCILSATGVISNVTLRQPDSSGGTLTYEGRFELLSLCGSFMPTESGEIRSRSGGISVSLASPDGRVIGGGLAGLLVAASPMQVVVASFMPHSQTAEMRKPRQESPSIINVATSASPMAAGTADLDQVRGGATHHGSGGIPRTTSLATPISRGDNWPLLQHSAPESRSTTDINVDLHSG